MFAKRHYEAIAAALRRPADLLDGVDRPLANAMRELPAMHMAEMFRRDNDRFDKIRFLKACGIEEQRARQLIDT